MRKKRKKRKLPSKKPKGKITFAIVFSFVIMIFAISLFGMFNVGRKEITVYDGDLTITEPLASGLSIPNFSATKGDMMNIYVTNFDSNEGYSLVITLQGAGIEWRKVVKENSNYRRTFEESSIYNLELAINNLDPIEGSSINLHLKVVLT